MKKHWIKEEYLDTKLGRPPMEEGVLQRWFALDKESIKFELRISRTEFNHLFKTEVVLLEDGFVCDTQTETSDMIRSIYNIDFDPNNRENESITRMDIKEFREKGYLQEVNRRFLHPLGLALEVSVNDDGSEKLNGVWDYRNDEEGIIYDLENSDEERIEKFKKNEEYINQEFKRKSETRNRLLGFDIEPIKKK